jgi:hypothetical protein
MLGRIRQQPWRDVRIDWGSEPVWQSAAPAAVFGGDTVIAFAGVAARTHAAAVRMLATDAQGATTELARGEAEAPCPGDKLPRIAASHRMSSADDTEVLVLALDYQLMSKQTNCILVHRRADADKTTEQAELHRVSSMLAAGWGATSTVMESASIDYAAFNTRSVWQSARSHAASDISFCLASTDDFEVPAFLRKQVADLEPASLLAIALAVAEHLEHGEQVQGLASHCENLDLHADVRLALAQALDLGASEGVALLLLAHWANVRERGLEDPLVAATLLPHLGGLDTKMIDGCIELFDRLLGGFSNDHWRSSRAQRLQQALTQAAP